AATRAHGRAPPAAVEKDGHSATRWIGFPRRFRRRDTAPIGRAEIPSLLPRTTPKSGRTGFRKRENYRCPKKESCALGSRPANSPDHHRLAGPTRYPAG